MVEVSHVGVPCHSQREADAFFTGVLGLPLVRTFSVSSELGSLIFRMSGDVEVLIYDNGALKMEVFVTPHGATFGYAHLALQVQSISQVFDRCRHQGIDCFSVPRGEKQLYFIRDPAGNLYELSEKKP